MASAASAWFPARRLPPVVTQYKCMLLWCLLLLTQLSLEAAATYHLHHAFHPKSPSNTDWYIVLVSIPVLHKVLPLKYLAEELLHRGYRVGFALPENCRHWVSDLDQLEFISLGNIVGRGRSSYVDFHELQTLGIYESYASTLRYYASFQRPMYRALLEDLEDDRPNVVVVDRYTFAGMDVSHALNIPYVINNPFLLLDMDSPPAYIPAPYSNFTMTTTSVLERCLNSYYRLRFRLTMVHLFHEINQVRREHGLLPITHKDELYGHQLVLVNSVFGLEDARPMAPHFQMVGILRARDAASHLPASLASWLQATPTKPVIFITFHPDVPLSPAFLAILMDGLESVQARLAFKITLQQQAAFNLRSRDRASLFFIQDDTSEAEVMASRQLSLVITAGEFQTVQEALYAGLPVLGIPFSAEQMESVNAVVRANAGLVLTAESFTERHVKQSVQSLLFNASFRASAQRLGSILQLSGGTPRAADYVVSVVQDGAVNLLPMRNMQPLYKTYLVDVYLVYGAILCGAAVILRTFVSVVCSIFQTSNAPVDSMKQPPTDEETTTLHDSSYALNGKHQPHPSPKAM